MVKFKWVVIFLALLSGTACTTTSIQLDQCAKMCSMGSVSKYQDQISKCECSSNNQ